MSWWSDKNEFYEVKEIHKPEVKRQEEKLVKDMECVSCNRLFDCKGKRKGISCNRWEKRKC